MANSEHTFREELITSFRASHRDCQPLYITDKFHAGRSDLYVKHPEFPGTWIELKYKAATKESVMKYGIQLLITKAQRIFLEKTLKSGDIAGWAICVKVSAVESMLFLGCDPHAARALKSDYVQSRAVGGMWSAQLILSTLEQRVKQWRGD